MANAVVIAGPRICPHGVYVSAMHCEMCSGPASGSWAPGGAPRPVTVPSDFWTAPAAATQQGWECPKCQHVYSPAVAVCMYCPGKDEVITNAPSTG